MKQRFVKILILILIVGGLLGLIAGMMVNNFISTPVQPAEEQLLVIKPGTSFEDLPEGWTCPECGATMDRFEQI